MNQRKGERYGWTLGFLGGFMWLPILSCLWFVQGKPLSAIVGFGLFALAFVFIFLLAPWRYPETRMWKLLVPIYSTLVLAVVLAFSAYGGTSEGDLSLWTLLCLTPAFTPFFTLGGRRWIDGQLGNQ